MQKLVRGMVAVSVKFFRNAILKALRAQGKSCNLENAGNCSVMRSFMVASLKIIRKL